MNPPYSELYRLVADQAPKFHARDNAPGTFAELHSSLQGELCVYAGASELTVFGSPLGNHMFRAWHDTVHYRMNCDFSMGYRRGEWYVAMEQCRIAAKSGTVLADWLCSDLRGQEEYFLLNGHFPVDQVSCATQYFAKHFR